jgi:hypothetical protein
MIFVYIEEKLIIHNNIIMYVVEQVYCIPIPYNITSFLFSVDKYL